MNETLFDNEELTKIFLEYNLVCWSCGKPLKLGEDHTVEDCAKFERWKMENRSSTPTAREHDE